jgi:decaprenylphospho-beta-D-erythro-pentofuranosid-2-ulose 2-reductase
MYLLIIGANSDIGKAIAHVFAKNGFNLYLAARDSKRLHNFSSDIQEKYKIDCEFLEFDVTDYNKHTTFYHNLTHKPLGTICVSGYYFKHEDLNLDFALVKNIYEANLLGCVSILNAVALDLSKRKEGFIIGISSVAGDRGRKSNYLYGSAKSGFNIYLDGLRIKLFNFNVKVITVKPGYVKTKMTSGMNLPNSLLAEPEEIAIDIYKGWKTGKDVIYTKWYWRYIMLIIRNIPNFIFKRMSL